MPCKLLSQFRSGYLLARGLREKYLLSIFQHIFSWCFQLLNQISSLVLCIGFTQSYFDSTFCVPIICSILRPLATYELADYVEKLKKREILPLNENDGPRLVRPNKPTFLTIAPNLEQLFVKSDAWKQIVRQWQFVGRPPTSNWRGRNWEVGVEWREGGSLRGSSYSWPGGGGATSWRKKV